MQLSVDAIVEYFNAKIGIISSLYEDATIYIKISTSVNEPLNSESRTTREMCEQMRRTGDKCKTETKQFEHFDSISVTLVTSVTRYGYF